MLYGALGVKAAGRTISVLVGVTGKTGFRQVEKVWFSYGKSKAIAFCAVSQYPHEMQMLLNIMVFQQRGRKYWIDWPNWARQRERRIELNSA